MIDEGKYPREIAFEFQIKMARLESNSGVSIHCKNLPREKRGFWKSCRQDYVYP